MKKDKNSVKLAILWIVSFILIMFIMSFSSHAQGLPYIVSNENIENYDTFNAILINSKGLNMNNLPDYSFGYPIFEGGRRSFVLYIPNETPNYEFTLTSTDYESFDLDTDRAQLHLISSYRRLQWHIEYSGTAFYGSDNSSVSDININFFDGTNDGYGNELTPKYSMSNYLYEGSEYDVVFGFGAPTRPVDIGVAIVPPSPILPEYPSGTTPPAQVPPSYTPTDYQWTTPPTFDNSSVTNAIGSIQNTIGWLANNLKEEFKNLTDNGKHFFEYIGKTIQYYGNALLDTINNFMKNFYDNMKNIFEPIFQQIQDIKNKVLEVSDLIIHPFDEEEFEEQIDNCVLITRYNELLDNCEVIQQIFDETSEPDSFILYIDFENPFADSEHKIIKSEINFNWLVPLRSAYRPFLTVFTLIECFVGGFRILGNIIGGKAK